MTRDNVLIVGTGAMACLFAARLAPQINVTLLGSWQEGLTALANRGVVLAESDTQEIHCNVLATSRPEDCVGVSQALVLVKSWQTARAAAQLRVCLTSDGIALTLQNGLGNLEILQETLGPDRAALGVTTTGATLLGPGFARLGGSGPTYVVNHPRLQTLILLLRSSGFDVKAVDNLESLLWGKLVINAGINPLTALLRVPNGGLLRLPDAQALMCALAREAASVALAKGIQLPNPDVEKSVIEVAQRTAQNLSSMLQDRQRGAPTEIDAICGAVVREGRKAGVPTPLNETLWRLIRALISLETKSYDEDRKND